MGCARRDDGREWGTRMYMRTMLMTLSVWPVTLVASRPFLSSHPLDAASIHPSDLCPLRKSPLLIWRRYNAHVLLSLPLVPRPSPLVASRRQCFTSRHVFQVYRFCRCWRRRSVRSGLERSGHRYRYHGEFYYPLDILLTLTASDRARPTLLRQLWERLSTKLQCRDSCPPTRSTTFVSLPRPRQASLLVIPKLTKSHGAQSPETTHELSPMECCPPFISSRRRSTSRFKAGETLPS